MDDLIWPLRGVLLFLRKPGWWVRPILGMTLTLAAFLGLGIGTAWSMWPDGQTVSGIWWWAYAGIAVGLAVAAVLVAWVLLLPIVLSFLLEDLARKANAYAKEHADALSTLGAAGVVGRATSHELPMVPGLLASLKVLSWTLPIRFAWMGSSLISGFIIPPLGVVISALGMGHIACIDAIDIGLGLRGFDGNQRLAALKEHRNEIRQAALTAGLLHLGLAATIIGWVVWLPGVVVGAALRTRTWQDTRGGAHADSPAPVSNSPKAPSFGGSAGT